MNEPEIVIQKFAKEINLSPDEADRFWQNVAVKTPSDCWLWTLSVDLYGYGRFSTHKRHLKAHRVSWTLTNGVIPDAMRVCHNYPTGDNPLCCNPAHLFLGTQKENMEDAAKKWRTFRGSIGVVYKVTEEDIPVIRRRALTESALKVGLDYGITRTAVTAICRRERWAHVA